MAPLDLDELAGIEAEIVAITMYASRQRVDTHATHTPLTVLVGRLPSQEKIEAATVRVGHTRGESHSVLIESQRRVNLEE
jgi:hypothetical protein